MKILTDSLTDSAQPSWRRTVAEIRAVASRGGRERLGLCSLEGTRLFERALRAGTRIERALVERTFLLTSSPRIVALRAELATHGCRLTTIPTEEMEALTEGRSLGGIVGLARLPHKATLQEVLADAASRPTRLLVCAGFNDPGNLGAVARTAHGAGASALVCAGATGAFHPKAIRTSMGSLLRIPVLEYETLKTLVEELGEAEIRTVGAVTRGGTPLSRLGGRDRPMAVVFGSEAFGLSAEECPLLDELVTIPMAEGVDSFSVNAAAAMFLYELQRPIP
ncbi:MAG: hypothetical protein CMJ89_16410 [Planctomycetes bacterium]|nr:hypothetical protein [Planctomycetota bacterium]